MIAATHARTLAGSESSHASGTVSPTAAWHASRAFSTVRAVPTTRAPRTESTRSASCPRPELQPVTSIVLPSSDSPSVTSSAVDP